jgi:hypothetical protein
MENLIYNSCENHGLRASTIEFFLDLVRDDLIWYITEYEHPCFFPDFLKLQKFEFSWITGSSFEELS